MMQRSKTKFDMKKCCKKAVKVLKKKHGRKSKPSDIRRIWKQYVNAIVDELIKYGKVQIDHNFSLEIVGERIVDSPRLFAIMKRGIGVRDNIILPNAGLHKGRNNGVVYNIVLTDKNFREGKLIYKPTQEIRARVHHAITHTANYYRIAI